MSSFTARALHQKAISWLAQERPAIVVTVTEIKGSTPREVGARMLVSAAEVDGTIGGGHLEWQAINQAHQVLVQASWASTAPWQCTYPLGPTLGQCCGGVVALRFAPLTQATLHAESMPVPRFHLELHGAGHVGQALVRLLADIDCTVRWIDERIQDPADAGIEGPGLPCEADLAQLPDHIQWLQTDAADRDVANAPSDACHLVLTHRHDLDLRIISAVLRRGDFSFAGMIGSRTKRQRFMHRLAEQGIAPSALARLVCPIGIAGLRGKEPAVIAVSALAQLLQHSSQTKRSADQLPL